MQRDIFTRIACFLTILVFISPDAIASTRAIANWNAITEEVAAENTPEDKRLNKMDNAEAKTSKTPLAKEVSFGSSKQIAYLGVHQKDPMHSPGDDVFEFNIQNELDNYQFAYLSYRTKGIANPQALPKAVNLGEVYAGEALQAADEWITTTVMLDRKDLHSGLNKIRFAIAQKTALAVEVADVELKLSNEFKAVSKSLKWTRQEANTEDFKVLEAEEIALKTFENKEVEMASVPKNIRNITRSSWGYGSRENIQAARKISIAVDSKKLLSPSKLKQATVFYYDRTQNSWKQGEITKVDMAEMKLEANVPGNTDYFAGLIKTPDMPEASAYVSTAISGLEAANPSTGINLIAPPSQSRTGEARVSYPLKIPAGRQGISPNLAVNYSSDAGTGWMGLGWNIAMPSITVDTRWGVPEFDPNYQSEVYLLNGESLHQEGGTKANRVEIEEGAAVLSPREEGPLRFFPKTMSSYQSIERMGSAPDEYVWVVTMANQTKYYYGTKDGSSVDQTGTEDNSSALWDANGNIVKWCLTRVEDQWGNYMEYDYTQASIAGNSNAQKNGGTTMIPEKITYTGNGTTAGKYEVRFTASSDREDATINMKYGFKMVDNHQLDEISIWYDGDEVRNYKMQYDNTGKFFKTKLTSIAEYGKNGVTDVFFYEHTFDYYDKSFTYSAVEEFDVDNFSSNLYNDFDGDLNGFSKSLRNILYPSPIKTTSTYGFSSGGGIGVGVYPIETGKWFKGKKFKLSGGFDYAESYDKDRISLQDMNGDGLPDIVYDRRGGRGFFAMEQSGNGLELGSFVEIKNTDKLMRSRTFTRSYSFDFVGAKDAMLYLGKDWSYGTSEVSSYLTDYNADGYVDLVVKDGDGSSKVKFGGMNSEEEFTFYDNSSNTPNPVIKGATLANAEADEDYKDIEMVKTWTAPFSGTVTVTGTAEILGSNGGETQVAVQKNNVIQGSGFSVVNANNTVSTNHSIAVVKDDIIMFRVKSMDDGQLDLLTWNPNVEYIGSGLLDGNLIDYKNSSYEDAFILSGAHTIDMKGDEKIKVELQRTIGALLSDDIAFVMNVAEYDSEDEFLSETNYYNILGEGTTSFPNSIFSTIGGGSSINLAATSGQLLPNADAENNYQVSFAIFSTSNVDWRAVKFRPVVYTYASDDCDTETIHHPVIEYQTYNSVHEMVAPYAGGGLGGGVYRVSPSFNYTSSNVTGIFTNYSSSNNQAVAYFTVKENQTLLSKMKLVFDQASGQLWLRNCDELGQGSTAIDGSTDPAVYSLNNPDFEGDVYLEFFAEDPFVAEQVAQFITTHLTGIYLQEFEDDSWVTIDEEGADATIFYQKLSYLNQKILHWGQFAWSAEDASDLTEVIEPSDLKPGMEDIATQNAFDESNLPDEQFMDNNENTLNPLNHNFFMLGAIRGEKDFMLRSYEEDSYTDLSSASLVSSTVSNAEESLDRYSFMGTHMSIFASAGLSSPGKWGEPEEESLSGVASIPSSIYGAYATNIMTQSKSTSTTVTGALAGQNGEQGVSTNAADAAKWFNWSTSQFQDYNGDGYPDKVEYHKNSDNVRAYLTNPQGGHSSNLEIMTNGLLSKTVPLNISAIYAGAFVSKDQSEGSGKLRNRFADRPATLSASVGENYQNLMHIDLNGDGLPDRIARTSANNDIVNMGLGNGSGFESLQAITAATSKSRPQSVNWGAGLGLNVMKLLGVKSSGGKGFSAGVGINSTLNYEDVAFIDLNGDGLKDIVEKNGTEGAHDIYINTGNSWKKFFASPVYDQNVQESNTTGFNANGSYSYTKGRYPITVLGVPLELYGVITTALSGRASINSMNSSFIDVNGDGVLDYVKEGSYGSLEVQYAELNENNLLKTVTNPLKGSFTIEYDRVGNKRGYYAAEIKHHENVDEKVVWDMPNSKWVMAQLTVHDGYDIQHNNQSIDGEEETEIHFAYDGGIHSRREREFLGFTRTEKKFPPTKDASRRSAAPTSFTANLQSGDKAYYVSEANFYMAPIYNTFDYRKRSEYRKGLLKESITYYNELSCGTFDPVTETCTQVDREFYPINITQYEYDFRYVNITSGSNDINKVYIKNNPARDVTWSSVDETSTIFPAVVSITTANYPDVINSSERNKYFSQKFNIDYDEYFNVILYENEGEMLGRFYGTQIVDTYTRSYYDHVHQDVTISNGTIRQDLSDANFTVYEFQYTPDNTYSNYFIYVPAAPDPCYQFEDLLTVGDNFPIRTYHKKLLEETVNIYQTSYNDVYDNKVIAVMEYFTPAQANEQTHMLKTHDIYHTSINSANLMRETEVSALRTDGKAPATLLNHLGATSAQTDITYDNTTGNVTDITMPENYDGDRITVDYTYDTEVEQFVIEVTNQAYNETSKYNYDFATGNLLKSLDINGQAMRYQYDDLYRLEKVWAPREYYTSGSAPTISYEYDLDGYNPSSNNINHTVPLAITTHNLNTSLPTGYTVPAAYNDIDDLNETELNGRPAISNSIKTITFVDGVNRVIQVKKETPKQSFINSSTNDDDWLLSGFAAYDQWGEVKTVSDMESVSSSIQKVLHTFSGASMQTNYSDYMGRPSQNMVMTGATANNFTTNIDYGWDNGPDGIEYMLQEVTGVTTHQTLTDSRGRTRWSIQTDGSNTDLETKFEYDVLNQMLETTNPMDQITEYEYDNFGRTIQEIHPDRGTTDWTYDLVGNITKMVTPGTGTTGITYEYDNSRLTDKLMPNSPDEIYDVKYIYGSSGDGKNGAGRIVAIEQGAPDANGDHFKEDFYKYDELGNQVYEEKRIDVPQHGMRTYVTESSFDTWGRTLQIIYPDQEEVNYTYTSTGDLYSISTLKHDESTTDDIISYIAYDGYGNIQQMRYGNQARIDYEYNDYTRTIDQITHNAYNGSNFMVAMDQTFTYDSKGRILNLDQTNGSSIYNTGVVNTGHDYTYGYDAFNRLTSANGTFTYSSGPDKSFTLAMDYNAVGGIEYKNQSFDGHSYNADHSYDYGGQEHRLLEVEMGTETLDYTYLSNTQDMGSIETINSDVNGITRFNWNEEQWLNGVYNSNGYHHYVYDHAGERIMKSSLTNGSTANNGQNNVGLSVLDPYTVYVNPYYVTTGFDTYDNVSKHYYMGMQRIATEIVTYAVDQNEPDPDPDPEGETSGKTNNEASTVSQVSEPVEDPANNVPTTSGTAEDIENPNSTGPVLTHLMKVLTTFELEEGKDYRLEDLKQTQNMLDYYPHLQVSEVSEPVEDVEGPGISANNATPETGGDDGNSGDELYHTHDRYWYHPNYLGNVDMLTDEAGEMYHYYVYSPFGENLYEWERSADYSNLLNYHFNSKELDGETGNMYYGARYYDPKISVWLSVDPLAHRFTSHSPYNFVLGNPIEFIDPDGKEVVPVKKNASHRGAIKSVHDLGYARLGQTNIVPAGENKFDLHIEILVSTHRQFGLVFLNSMEVANPGLHREVQAHENAHFDQMREIVVSDIYLDIEVDGRTFENYGKLDESFSLYYEEFITPLFKNARTEQEFKAAKTEADKRVQLFMDNMYGTINYLMQFRYGEKGDGSDARNNVELDAIKRAEEKLKNQGINPKYQKTDGRTQPIVDENGNPLSN